MNKNVSDTIGIIGDYSVIEYLNSLLDEELYSLIKIDYNNEIMKIFEDPEFKKLFEKVAEYSNNRNNSAIIICEAAQHIEKEVVKRWIKYIEKRVIK